MTSTSKPKLQDITASITSDELIAYLKKIQESDKNRDVKFECHYCKSEEWLIKPYPGDADRPLLVAHPIPQKNLSAWYFPVSCRECGYAMFFDAQLVAVAIEKQRKKENADV